MGRNGKRKEYGETCENDGELWLHVHIGCRQTASKAYMNLGARERFLPGQVYRYISNNFNITMLKRGDHMRLWQVVGRRRRVH